MRNRWVRCGLLVLIALAVPLAVHAQLAQNGTSTLAATWTPGTLTSTFAHTTPALQNSLLMVAVHMNMQVDANTAASVASVTYNGAPLFFGGGITDAGNDVRTELWVMVAPATGSHSVVVTMANITGTDSIQGVVGATTYVDVDQTLTGSVGYTASGNSNAPTNGGLAGTAAGDLVFDFMTARDNGTLTASVGAGQASVYNTKSPAPLNGNDALAVSSTEVSTGAAVTMSYTLNAARDWAMVGGSLRGARTDVGITGVATPDIIDVGANSITFTFTITAYSVGANNINFADTLPAGLTIVSATPSQGTCTPGATTNCSIGSLAAGASATITLVASTVGGTPGVTYNNSASISVGTTDAVAANNSVTLPVRTQGQLCATPGQDGAGGTLSGTVNTYFPGTVTAAPGATSITVGAVPVGYGVTGITSGDLLLVIQMQDATIDSSNDELYGDGTGLPGATGSAGSGVTNFNNAGRYEYVVASNTVGTGGGAITISGAGTGGGLIYAYTNANATGTMGQRRFQVIRVPQHTSATVSSAIAVPAWNGNVGGALILDAAGTVTMGSNAGTGTVATTAGSPVVTGTGTAFLNQLHSGDVINITGETAKTVVSVVSNTQLWTSANMAVTGTGRTFTVPTLSVSSSGFRGSAGRQIAGAAGADTDYRTTATTATNAQKGEGYAGTPRYIYDNTATPLDTAVEGYPNGSSARGAPGNAGGGGTDGNPAANDENTGGGGGANGGAGGNGGNAWNSADPAGGFGGIFPVPSTTRLVFGGGGGAGTTNNGTSDIPAGVPAMGAGIASSGSAGGGLVIIRANAITGTGTIAVNGGWSLNVGNDAGGGGGAGGTVVINTRFGTLTGLTVQARGGRGGAAWLTQGNPAPPNDYPGERHGPGGGGGGGVVYLASAAASVDVTGGVNGLTTTANDNFGANPGQPGVTSTPLGVMAGTEANYGCAVADLGVTNTDTPDPVTPGANITYTQTVTNNGPNAADQPVFTTTVPASATFVSITPPAGWTCPIQPAVGGTGLISCINTSGTMASGASAAFAFVAQAHLGTPAGYIISNTANISSQTYDSNPANDSATTTTAVTKTGFADLSVVITDTPDPVLANTNITYAQTVTNGGASAAANATFTETIPANTTFQSLAVPPGWSCVTPLVGATGTITCTNPSLASGATASFPMVVHVNAGTTAGTVITETATVSSTTPDANTSNNSSTTTTTVRATGTADLAVTVVASPDPVSPGDVVTFTETVTNNGPSTSSTVSFTQQVPTGTTFQSITPPAGWTCGTVPPVGGTGTITCTRATFPIGTVSTFAVAFRVNGTTTPGTVLTLPGAGAVVSAATTDPVAGNNSANDSVLVASPTNADLAIVKTDSPDPVGQGQLVTYILRVTNNGPAVATGIVVSDTLPASAPLVSFAPSQGSCSGTTTITCNLGTLAVGNNATISIVVQAQSTGTITNNCSVTGTQTDPVPSNNSDSEPTTVLAVTLARLRRFAADRSGAEVHVLWQTDFESRNLGFNLYREADGVRTKINPQLIAGSALSVLRDAKADRVYRYTDKSAPEYAQYWVEDVDLSGATYQHGPIVPSGSGNLTSPNDDSLLLDALDDNGSIFASPAGYGVVPSLELAWDETQLQQQFDLAGTAALKIYIDTEGWHRLTRADIVTAGFAPGTDASRLSLFSVGSECAIVVNQGGNGQFDEPSDSIEFFGLPVDTASTGSRVYWLVLDTGDGDRVAITPQQGGAPLTVSVPFAHQRFDRSIWFPAATSNVEGQNYFGPIVTSSPSTQDLTLGNVDTGYAGNASLAITLQGGTEVEHSVEVSMNGHVVGIATYENLDQSSFSFDFPHSWLISGTNVLSVRSLGGDDDVSGVASTRVDYHHLLTADDGALLADMPAGTLVTVAGFAPGGVRAVDITDRAQPSELETTVDGSGNATFTPVGSGTRTVFVFHESRVLTPPSTALNQPSTWHATKATNAADLVIVSNAAFLATASTLKPVRDAEGIDTTVLDVEDLYDEFHFGIRDPQAIRSFLADSQGWSGAPQYALMVGDASIDPRNYLGVGSYDLLPTKLVVTTGLKTASDDWLADFNDDGIADLAVGRIPVRTAEDATRIFGRLTSRGTPTGPWSNSALLVSDAPGDYDFEAVSNSLVPLLPTSMSVQHIDFENNPSAGSQIVSSINDGKLLVNFIGHGSTEIWSDDVFDTSTALTLSNGSELPFVVIMNCLNGYYHDLFTYSLAEGFLNAPDGGAIAVWASSSLTQPDQQAVMNRELYRQLFSSSLRIGEAVRRAKFAATDTDVRKSWILFGDPSMALTSSTNETPVTLSTVSATPESIIANGSSTSTIIVQHKDDNGNNVTTGGASVVLSTTSGTLSAPVDNLNGTYTAVLTAPTTTGAATISGTLNGLPLANMALVTLSPGPAVSFTVTAPTSTVAGQPFTVIVAARDAHGNTATDYTGALHFTSNDPDAVLPPNQTLLDADDGVFTFTNVALQTSGLRSVVVRDQSNPSVAGSANVTVSTAETSTFVTSSPNPSAPAETVTLSANVTSNTVADITGIITFRDGETTLGTAPLNNNTASLAIATLTIGTHSITAFYGGDTTFAASTSAVHSHDVLPIEIGVPVVGANATSPTSVSITWTAASGASGYDIFRSTANGPYSMIGQSVSPAFVDNTVSANTSYLYKVRGRDGGGSTGALSAANLATTVIFTDDPVIPATTPVKAIHIVQLRIAVNAVRTFAGLSAAAFTDPILAAGDPLRAVHITELRTALDAARSSLGLAPLTYTDPTIVAGTTMAKRAHIMELRDGVR